LSRYHKPCSFVSFEDFSKSALTRGLIHAIIDTDEENKQTREAWRGPNQARRIMMGQEKIGEITGAPCPCGNQRKIDMFALDEQVIIVGECTVCQSSLLGKARLERNEGVIDEYFCPECLAPMSSGVLHPRGDYDDWVIMPHCTACDYNTVYERFPYEDCIVVG